MSHQDITDPGSPLPKLRKFSTAVRPQPWFAVGLVVGSGVLAYLSAPGATSHTPLQEVQRMLAFLLAVSGTTLLLSSAMKKLASRSLALRASAFILWIAVLAVASLVAGAYHVSRVRRWLDENKIASARSAQTQELLQAEEALDHWSAMGVSRKPSDWDQRYEAATARADDIMKTLIDGNLGPELRAAVMRVDWALSSRVRKEQAALADARAGRFEKAEAALASADLDNARRTFHGQARLLLETFEQQAAESGQRAEAQVKNAAALSVLFATLVAGLAGFLAWRLARALRQSTAKVSATLASALAAHGVSVEPSAQEDEICRLGSSAQALISRIGEIEEIARRSNQELSGSLAASVDLTRLKGDFLEKMNRELRSPVNGVAGMATLLSETSLSDEQREYATDLQKSVGQLIAVLDQMADFSRIESGNLKLEKIDFDLRLLMLDVIDRARIAADTKDLDLTIYFDEEVPSLLSGDPGRLRQVLRGLLDNAIKFTPSGEVSTRVSVGEETPMSVTLKFTIEDTGVGIDRERQQTLFDEFSEAGLSYTRVSGVSGLGLTLSREIVKLMKGNIQVKSAVGKGSTFEFTAVLEKQPRRECTRAPFNRTGRVFVIAANSGRRQKFSELLPNLGMDFSIFRGCGEALDALKRAAATAAEAFSLGFFDELGSEGETGMLFQELRHTPDLLHVPVVLIAAAGRRGDAEYARNLGCAGYLNGELTSGLLASVSARLLRNKTEEEKNESDFVTRHSVAEYRRRTGRVLLAEDDAINQKLVLAILRKAGLRADAVDNGRAALAAVASRRYDVVLMDCTMPEMDGFEATKEIRRRENGGRRIPIIAFTALTSTNDREHCFKAGMDDYLSKPIIPQTLLGVVDRWILETSSEEDEPFYMARPANGLSHSAAEDMNTYTVADDEEGRKLIQSFISEGPRQISAARRAVHARRPTALERATSQLKDVSLVLGVYSLSRLLEQIEFCATHDNLDAAHDLLNQAEAEFKKTQAVLVTKFAKTS